MRKGISLNEMRDLVGPLLFGDDLLGGPSAEDEAMLKAFGPISYERPSDIAKCPLKNRPALDRALGRYWRRRHQGFTIDSWIESHGWALDLKSVADGASFNQALKLAGKSDNPRRGAGRPPDVVSRAVADLRLALARGDFTPESLEREKQDALGRAWDVPQSQRKTLGILCCLMQNNF